jgi:hypothetical protein
MPTRKRNAAAMQRTKVWSLMVFPLVVRKFFDLGLKVCVLCFKFLAFLAQPDNDMQSLSAISGQVFSIGQ